MKITKQLVTKINDLLDAGLVKGMGHPKKGEMCVEAAICFALGLPHGDDPKCVGQAVRAFKITLNDCNWSSNKARAEGMRGLAIAQLGSNVIDQKEFTDLVCIKGVQKILPPLFRYLAGRDDCKDKQKFLDHADECEKVANVIDASKAAKSASAYAYASASAYASAYPSAYASAYADAYADASASAYAYAYASASAYPSAYASASASAYPSAYASAYADADADVKKSFGNDFFLNLTAKIGLEALIELKSEGSKWIKND